MEADFSGYATKAGLKCSDGRTIMPDAFKDQDKVKVPLVWQHGHNNIKNVLGHALLENRSDGVYAYGFFNNTDEAKTARELVQHGDINFMSIWANQLVERAKRVFHGAIKEVSLVLGGANPGALIDNVVVRHSDDTEDILEDDVIITTGLSFEHAAGLGTLDSKGTKDSKDSKATDDGDQTVQEIVDSMSDKQKEVLHFMVGQALSESEDDEPVSHADAADGGETVQDIYNSMTDKQKQVLHYMVGQALEEAGSAQHSDLDEDEKDESKGKAIMHNVFESEEASGKPAKMTLSHSDVESIVTEAKTIGSFKKAVEAYALSHGIDDIEILFPEARNVSDTPELFARRTEWVQKVIGGAVKSPFSRIKTMYADLTVQSARAKGYIKGTMKKEEFFKVARRSTTPTTIYKKQKLDRDDIIDITDFDVVVWLKAEMRLMLDEEIARAVLIGDGRDAADEDKVDEEKIRPIASDHEMYTTTVYVNIDDSNSSIEEVTDAIINNRNQLRGTGLPTFFTSETYISRYMSLRDNDRRKMYRSLADVATELRVSEIVPVEVLEEYDDIVGILVNMVDYRMGADSGGQVSMFDDFDIDYNQQKYLIETRMSGALTKLKSAMVVRKTAGTNVLVVPAEPAFDGDAITIVNQTGVVYRNAATDAVMNAAGSPYPVADGETVMVQATPAAGYYFASSDDDSWAFTGEA